MKRIFVILLTFVLLLGICPMSALAETGGSGNVDGGGGDMGQGTSQNSWNPGMDGVRITVVDAESGQPVSSSFDLTNKTPSIKIHFGKVSKIQYANGASISPTTGNYDYYTPATPMPRIVSSGSQNASIEAIKKYFCSEYAVKLVAQQTGIAYEELIGGQYKLFLEPIAYFKHNGIMMAMTAHEAALYVRYAVSGRPMGNAGNRRPEKRICGLSRLCSKGLEHSNLIAKEEETRMRLFLFYTFSRFCRQRLIASMTAA